MAERNADYRHMENNLYTCMYEVLNSDETHKEKLRKLNSFRAKIMRLHANRIDQIMLDQAGHDTLTDELPSLFHLIKQKKRREKRTITAIQDGRGEVVTDTAAICTVFETFVQKKYEQIDFDSKSTQQMVRVIQSVESPPYAEQLEKPITEDELFAAIGKGATNKVRGVDGLGIEFYKMNWEIIGPVLLELINHMFLHQMVTPQQKHGIICLPKDNGTHTPAGYRPITLLTTEYKLLARIMATRLHLVLQDQLSRSQYCGVPGNTIMDAVMKVRDAIAYSESTDTPLCILSLDFQ
jgi:hypothetical protein